jgi:hypothetical protein
MEKNQCHILGSRTVRIPKSGPFGLYTVVFFLLLGALRFVLKSMGVYGWGIQESLIFIICISMWYLGLLEGKFQQKTKKER